MPSDRRWSTASIGQIATVVGGGTPKTAVPEYWDGDIPWLTPRDLSKNRTRWVHRGERSISEDGLNSSSARLHPRGTVLVSSRAPIGYVALAANPIATNQGFRSLVVKAGHDPEFYYYVLSTMKEDMEQVAGGSTFKEISGKVLKTLTVPVPPLAEQRAIAEILGALDDQIEHAEKSAGTARALLVATVGTADKSVPLHTVCDLVKVTLPSASLTGKDWLHYSIPAFDEGEQPAREDGDTIKSGKFDVPAGAVLVSKLNPHTPRVWLTSREADGNAICSTELLPLVPSEGCSLGFLYGALLADAFTDQLLERVSGGTASHQRVRPDDVLAARVPDPGALTTEHHALLNDVADHVLAARRTVARVRRLLDTLLPKLVSGEVRVEDPEALLKGAA